VGTDIYLGVGQTGTPPPANVDVIFDWADMHWGIRVMTVRDLDGRLFRFETPRER
jgi:hypothetical protein